jgi:hypothetical protein
MNSNRLIVVVGLLSLSQAIALAAPPLTTIYPSSSFNAQYESPTYRKSNIWSLAANDDYIVVGLWPNTLGLPGVPQSAFAYRADTMQLLHELKPLTPDGFGGESFGSSVAISGNLAVVGSRFEHVRTPNGVHFNAGAAHVFDLTTGQEVSRLFTNDATRFLGEAVAIDGTTVLVGGRGGPVYMFDAISGEQLAKIEPSGSSSYQSALAIDGSLALIRSHVIPATGQSYDLVDVVDLTTKSKVRTIAPSDLGGNFSVFSSLVLDGNIAVLGSANTAVYVMEVTTGIKVAELRNPTALPGQSNFYFGSVVAIHGDRVLVGTPSTAMGSGEAFIFDWRNEMALAQLLPTDPGVLHFFGTFVTLSGQTAFVAGEGWNSVYAFRIPEPQSLGLALTVCFCLIPVRVARSLRTQPLSFPGR